jgi:hypothetical protein
MAKYRARLSSAETGMYDLMLKTSELLKGLAQEVHDDLVGDNGTVDEAHEAVTYAFTLGVKFAVDRQQEVARQVAKKMGLVPEDS